MLHQNYNLKHLNTFGIDVKATHFLQIENVEDYISYLETNNSIPPKNLILGGGSNLLFLNDFDGLIIHPTKKEIIELKKDEKHVWVEVSAAVVWDDFVQWAVDQNFGGIVNLTDIPGCVGASPVQNIGAYGSEAKDTIDRVKGFYMEDGSTFELKNEACHFAYRDSIFKQQLKGKVLITSVVYRLDIVPSFNLSYGNLEEKVQEKGEITLKNVRQSVREIRASKLPAVEEFGNAGSFFKNPVIPQVKYEQLKSTFPSIPGYKVGDDEVKVPAAWLIEQCGLKGTTLGKAQIFQKQPLVIVNTGGATGQEIFDLAQMVIAEVNNKFSITLHPEVNIIS